MHPLSCALALSYVVSHVTCGAFVAQWRSFTPPCHRTSTYCWTIVPLSVSQWNDLNNPAFDGAGLADNKSRSNALLLA